MRRADFHYDLPEDLIAQEPLADRSASRLLCVDGASGEMVDRRFADLPELLAPGDLLVLNDTRVMPARVFGTKATGGRVEVLVERLTGPRDCLAHARASKTPRPGSELYLDGGARARVAGREGDLFHLELDRDWRPYMDAHGHVPLPPYIQRPDGAADRDRYQTVYANEVGAVAAPTAGLHFDEAMLDRLAALGVDQARVTLHVGAGTFQPVRADDISDHVMHEELLRVDGAACDAIHAARARGGRVVAVGTTVVRSLETAALGGESGTPEPFEGATDLFITPGYRFRAVDLMLTNFHLPESTLLMLVSAFAGRDAVLAAYRHAVAARYRFFSYGDAMLLAPSAEARA